MKKKTIKKPYVIIRTYSAGVHCGTLENRKGKEVTLSNARRVWYWNGAKTLHEMSQNGFAVTSKISQSVPEITLTEAIEILPCSTKAQVIMEQSIWA